MALTFGALTSDRVDYGSAANLDNLATFSLLMWIFPTAFTDTRFLFSKAAGNAGKVLRLSGTGGDVLFSVDRGTDTVYVTNSNPLNVGVWNCLCISFDVNAGAGEIVNIYYGTTGSALAEATYGTATDGANSLASEAAQNVLVGNSSAFNRAFQGDIAVVMVWDRALSLAEFKTQQFHPRRTSGCVLFSHLGYMGVGTQVDWSGNASNGTITGATQAAIHAPLRPPFALDIGWQGNFGAPALLPKYPAINFQDPAIL